jgi:hypothetical protein
VQVAKGFRGGTLDGILVRGYTVVKWSNHQTTRQPTARASQRAMLKASRLEAQMANALPRRRPETHFRR